MGAYVLLDKSGAVVSQFEKPQAPMDGYTVIDAADPRIAAYDAKNATPPPPAPGSVTFDGTNLVLCHPVTGAVTLVATSAVVALDAKPV